MTVTDDLTTIESTTAPSLRTLELHEVMWLVGIVEGEGCIDVDRGRPRLRIGMSDRDIVARCADLMGARLRLSLHKGREASMWHAEITGAKADHILWQLLPHLGARRSAAAAHAIGTWRMRDKPERGTMPGPKIERPPGIAKAA